MKKIFSYGSVLLAIALAVSLFSACKKKVTKDPFADVEGNYFSIRQFGIDQWNTYAGVPFVILKTEKIGNKTDSMFTNSDTLNWGDEIFRTFFETDISDRKWLGQYTFTQFDDNQEATHNFYYKANDPEMFTQKLLITIDAINAKVKGVYIETYKKTIFDECKQILYYNPMHTVQIQTDDKPAIGSRKYKVVEYYFMR